MAIRLRLDNYQSKIPIRVGGILPDTAGCQLEDLKRRAIWLGNRQVELGELFELTDVDALDSCCVDPDLAHYWEGDLSSVHEIGLGLEAGLIQIEGHAGRHVGAHMQGGMIEVNGSVSDFLGAEMNEGQIRVSGDAGDWTGAVYPGTKSGIAGGKILVGGHTGAGAGTAMRRGTIVIGGTAGHQLGWNMRAGTILVGAGIEGSFGTGMIRGTIMTTTSIKQTIQQSLGPTFRPGSRLPFPMIHLFQNWLADSGNRQESIDRLLDFHTYQVFHGDFLSGGRGEVLVAECD